MNWTAAIVVYVILWWVVFFMALPFGVRGLHEDGAVEGGLEPGAPQNPRLGRKALAATGIAAILWVVIYIVIKFVAPNMI